MWDTETREISDEQLRLLAGLAASPRPVPLVAGHAPAHAGSTW